MKANELMMGDWVMHNDGTPMRVSVVKQDCFACSSQPHLYDYNNEFYPIPLTPEILEANGFKDYGEIKEYQFEEDGEKYAFYLKAMYNKNNVRDAWGTNIGGVLPSVIMYVHELQHALRLCGLGEIADNLKVK